MKRSPSQRLSLVAAALCGAAPLGFGLLRALRSGHDLRMFWMALASSIFAASVLGTAIGRRRSHRVVRIQAVVIFVVATLLAAGVAYWFGARAWFGIWAVAAVLAFCLAVASVLVAFARPSPRAHS